MAISIYSNSGNVNYGIKHYTVDTKEDLKKLPTNIKAGSTAFVVNSSKTYRLNSTNEWKEDKSASVGGITPEGEKEINTNGIHDIEEYKTANVNVPVGVFPEGEEIITENGNYDITEKAIARVNVPVPPEYIIPTGSIDITQNGQISIAGKATANVNVPGIVPAGTKLITQNVTGEDVTNYAAVDVAVPEYDDGGWGREVDAPNLDLLMLPGRELASGSGYNVIFCSFKIERKFPDGNFIRFNDGKPSSVQDVIINKDGTYTINEQVSYNNGYLYPSNLSVGWHVFRFEYTGTTPAGVSFYGSSGTYSFGNAVYEWYVHLPLYRWGMYGYHCKVIDSSPITGKVEINNNKLIKIDFVNCDFSNVTSLQRSFLCNSLKEVDLHNMDFSSVTTMQGMFEGGIQSATKINMSGIKTRDLTNVVVSCAYSYALQYADFRFDFCGGNFGMNLSYAIGTLLFDSDCQMGSCSITSCGSLIDIIGFPHANGNVTIEANRLTVESLMTVIIALNTVTETKTLNIGATNIAKLTADQIAIAQDKGWTVT